MAWRIDEQVVRGEIDNRERGRVTGRIWFHGRNEAVELELKGNAWRDLAGHLLKFTNPDPKPGDLSGLKSWQEGAAGDITASRKVKVPDCSMEKLMELISARKEFPWHWGNSFYLEWFSMTNGRVVIESASYHLELDPDATWTMSEDEEVSQREANSEAMMDFMNRLGGAVAASHADEEPDDDEPTSQAEADADAEDARMQLLLDRVTARMEREGHDEEPFERIYDEERARLMRERGEKEVELPPELEEERQRMLEDVNDMLEGFASEEEAEKWKQDGDEDDLDFRDERHPLVECCSDLAVELHHDVAAGGWLPQDAQSEHPIREIVDGVMCASAKLGGALCMADEEEWPPEPLIAGNVLVRLEKARGYLRDALSGIHSADEEGLATPKWRHQTKIRIIDILAEVQELIRQVRQVLQQDENEDPGTS